MNSLWSDAEAREFVDRYAGEHGEDLALRVYSSRLIGRDQGLVLHGGGNTSVKTVVKDRVLGTPLDVLCVKGSGWDLVSIEPAGLPAVLLEPLQKLRGVARLSDEEMVNQVRTRLLDATAPTPSVEALLHAFLPQRFVDHTHADAIVVLTNQPDGEAMIREAMGDSVAILPWIMPGHPLADAVADAYQAQPDCEGVVLLNHGIFTFDDDARTSYERMIELCDRAERFAADRAKGHKLMVEVGAVGDADARRARAAEVLPVIRGALAIPRGEGFVRLVADWRCDEDLVAFSRHLDARRLAGTGPLTPDHVIRTKAGYLFLDEEEAGDPARVGEAVARYSEQYRAYFEANKERVAVPPKMPPPTMLDSHPRVVVVEGLGLIAFGADAKAARIAGDIAEHTLRGKALAQAVGEYRALDAGELFEMEYWSLEQAKLGKQQPPQLAGRIALVTGAAGAIGYGIAEELLAAGCHLMLTDLDKARLDEVTARLTAARGGDRVASCVMDVTDDRSVAAAFDACSRHFGGLDCLVPNAGIAHVSTLAEMDTAAFERVLAVNLSGTMRVIREAAKRFERQGIGGTVVLQGSKNVTAPGAGFGAYSASKAGATQLAKVAAIELAPLGVRVNTIHADAVFGDEVPSGLWAEVGPDRMRSRNLDPQGLRDFYRDRSLLKVEVRAEHVGRATVFFAAEETPTTGAVLPVDAGVAAAFPR